EADAGKPKAEAARERLLALNSEIEVEAVVAHLTDLNAQDWVSRYDLVIDGTDHFETKFLINDAAYRAGIPLVYGAIHRFEGRAALFDGRRGTCLRCLHPTLPVATIRNCAEEGVLGALAGVVGSLQASLAVQCLASHANPAHPLAPRVGRLTLLDLSGDWSTRHIQVPRRDGCPTCSRHPQSVTLTWTPPFCVRGKEVSYEEAIDLMAKGKASFLDVRDPDEHRNRTLPGAVVFPLARISGGELPNHPGTDVTWIVVCKSGLRSRRAVELLMGRGIAAVSLAGGIR
ncbi:MAG: HesA/MoeB/ThiF family protein, partial [Bdellovibrionales bacterium]|nr:HesA/MoeB/ThiF family protein [Bdellovibrionales bacterium]